MTRTVGVLLVVVGVGVCLLGSALLVAGLASGQLQPAGAILGLGLLSVFVVAPLIGGGVLALIRDRGERVEQAQADAQRKILDMVRTRGKVNVSDIVIELQSDLPAVQDMIYGLVGMGVFSGYVNWAEGVLYSAEAASIREMQQCKHCGGNISLVGKGVLKCPYCGTEYFLS